MPPPLTELVNGLPVTREHVRIEIYPASANDAQWTALVVCRMSEGTFLTSRTYPASYAPQAVWQRVYTLAEWFWQQLEPF